eukprot:PhM_4_TR7661/c0_g1_i1/m.67314/K01517/ADPRM; manganese-dependent ADP-ribose/CDP-alcohol diphosphatase
MFLHFRWISIAFAVVLLTAHTPLVASSDNTDQGAKQSPAAETADPQQPQQHVETIALFSDVQYGANPAETTQTLERLKGMVAAFNASSPMLVFNLGDLVHEDPKGFAPVLDALSTLVPRGSSSSNPANSGFLHHVIGNRDLMTFDRTNARKEVMQKLGLAKPYYSVTSDSTVWKFVVLDGADVSFIATPPSEHAEVQKTLVRLLGEKVLELNHTDQPEPRASGAIGPEQMKWLAAELESTRTQKQHVIVFCHFALYPLIPTRGTLTHNLWNDEEVVELFSKYSDVVDIVFSAHSDVVTKYETYNAVHYVSLMGLVEGTDTKADASTGSYAIVKLTAGQKAFVSGSGRFASRVLSFDKEMIRKEEEKLQATRRGGVGPRVTPSPASNESATTAAVSEAPGKVGADAKTADPTQKPEGTPEATPQTQKKQETTEIPPSTDSTKPTEKKEEADGTPKPTEK